MHGRPRSILIILGIMSLVVAACTTGDSEATTSTTAGSDMTGATSPAPSTTVGSADSALAEPLPIDPDVTVGTMTNGLTYYIKQNDTPGGRLELRMMVDAGSVQEDADQSGGAHFLEHMMFNGTRSFPRNELIAALESFGPRFGPDINAYTSFDETVYELSLEADDELVDLGIQILREWASDATLTETDVIEERGIVLDEWRLRAQGFSGRIVDEFSALVLPGTVYEGQEPIGTPEAIETTLPDSLGRFYADWYRPDRIALSAVGDFNVEEMETQLVEAFSDLEGAGRDWSYPEYEPPQDPRARVLVDDESPSASVTVLWSGENRPRQTVGDYQDAVALSLALDVIAERLNGDALRGEVPILGASSLAFDYARTIGLAGVDIQVRPEAVERGFEALMTEFARVDQHGITEDEFDRRLQAFRAGAEQRRDSQDTVQDAVLSAQMIEHHLAGGDLMNPEQRWGVESGIAERLTAGDLELALATRIESGPMVLSVTPSSAEATAPSEERLISIVDQVGSMTIENRDFGADEATSLMLPPDPVEPISSEQSSQFDYRTVTYPNGATVYLWPTDIAEGSFLLFAESFGGTSVIDIEDLDEAFLMLDILSRSGVGPVNAAALELFLSDQVVQLSPWITETREGLTGAAATSDAETLLQLVNLYTSAPRFDDLAIDTVLDEMATLNASADDIPSVVFDEALDLGYYGDDPRYFVLPSDTQLASFDRTVLEPLYLSRFGNASDFAFAIVGDFEMSEMERLTDLYIGTLPGTGDRETWTDNQPLPPREIQIIEANAGSDPQGQIGFFFTNEFERTAESEITSQLLNLIVDARLRDRIREDLSATYSIRSGIDLQVDPDPFSEAFVLSTGAPEDLARISDEVIADLDDLIANGPTVQQFETAVAQLGSDLDLIDNFTLATSLTTAHLFPDQPVSDLSRRRAILSSLTVEDVRVLAAAAFNLDQRIEVRQGPSIDS